MAEEKITFVYQHAPNYRPEYISGVWGGINPSGLIEAHFYSDHIPLPETTIHKIEEGKMGKAISKTPEHTIGPTRIVKQGVVMDLQLAKSFRDWLDDKIGELERFITSQASE